MSYRPFKPRYKPFGSKMQTRPEPAPPVVETCRIQRWSDEMVCTTPGCNIRYDANDTPPPCPRDNRIKGSQNG